MKEYFVTFYKESGERCKVTVWADDKAHYREKMRRFFPGHTLISTAVNKPKQWESTEQKIGWDD